MSGIPVDQASVGGGGCRNRRRCASFTRFVTALSEVRPRIGHRVPAILRVGEDDLNNILSELTIPGQQVREPDEVGSLLAIAPSKVDPFGRTHHS